jgi:hypothetical protein
MTPDPQQLQRAESVEKPQAPALRERLAAALAGDDPRIGRLATAGTSVTFQIRDHPEAATTVLLDRDPPQVAAAVEPAEIVIEFDHAQAARFASGELSLPPRLLAGEVAYLGPIRKYLVVDPVLRAVLAQYASAG